MINKIHSYIFHIYNTSPRLDYISSSKCKKENKYTFKVVKRGNNEKKNSYIHVHMANTMIFTQKII